jgi:hypothetical protein
LMQRLLDQSIRQRRDAECSRPTLRLVIHRRTGEGMYSPAQLALIVGRVA